MRILLGALCGAALGSVPFAWLVHRAVTGRDLRREGSGNPGAANVQRSTGTVWGIVAVALDAGKAALAVELARRIGGMPAAIAAAAAAVVFHVASPWLAGRGGKGVAPAAGAFAMLAPIPTAAAVAAFGTVLTMTRFVSLASVGAAVILPIALAVAGAGAAMTVTALGVALLIAWRHRENFARMRRGTEPRARWSARGRGGGAS
jgi:glycerol-3-phosphate acyltransferase PlsY